MANRNQPKRWESAILAAALAIAGTLFLFDKLGATLWNSVLSWPGLLHSSPAALVAVAISLLWADQNAEAGTTSGYPPEGRQV